MNIVLNVLIVIITFFFMEGVAWFTHKYIMHGFLWSWHRSHHKVHPHPLEMNDLFAIVFSIPSIVCIYLGYANPNLSWLLYVGIGIFCYGVFYMVFHDIIVHRRIKIPFKARSKYMKRIMRAHYVHHENTPSTDVNPSAFSSLQKSMRSHNNPVQFFKSFFYPIEPKKLYFRMFIKSQLVID